MSIMFNLTKCLNLASRILSNPGWTLRSISTYQIAGPSGKALPYKNRKKPTLDRMQLIRSRLFPSKPPPKKVRRTNLQVHDRVHDFPIRTATVTTDPSRVDPARIFLTKGPKVIRRDHRWRNTPRRQYKDGDHVNANEMLRKQRAAIQWKAGQFVVTGSNRTLNAQVSGTLKFTTEYNPDKVNHQRPKYFTDELPEEEKLQTVVHVIPDEQHSRFKLIEQI
ncbi:uncharacterized protein [Amphiura filiformis]|uniref:uncharacterized protein n=1 Tax=Amphiura filiformis TaxID=82378 RepID=UPI003B2161D5